MLSLAISIFLAVGLVAIAAGIYFLLLWVSKRFKK